MPKITTRSGLVVGTELTVDETLKTFTLNVAGNMVAKDGVTLQALYSKFVELWATVTYQDSPFPMYAIDALSGQFQFGTDGATFSGWKPSNDATRQMLRDGGWSEFAGGTLTSIAVGAGGTGYGVSLTNIPVTITNGSPSVQGTATATSSAGGVIISVQVLTPGTGYTATPTIVIGGAGSGATATATVTTGGVLARQYVGIVSLGTVNAGSQLYYQRTSTGAPLNFTFTDAANEGIQVYGDIVADSATSTFDTRTFFKGYVREFNRLYKDSVLADTGKTSTGANLTNLLLSNEADLNIAVADAGIGASPYSEINVKYFTGAFNRDVDLVGTTRPFGIVVDVGTHSSIDGANTAGGSALTTALAGITGANYTGGSLVITSGTNKGTYTISGTPAAGSVTITGTLTNAQTGQSFFLQRAVPVVASLAQIYTKLQFQLRSAATINTLATSVIGKTAGLLSNFVGSTLLTGFFAPTNPAGGGTGVIVQGLQSADINSIDLYDNAAVKRNFPFAASGVISFNSVLVGAGSSYRLMYTSGPGPLDDYGQSGALTVLDTLGNPITGLISAGSISFTFDYDGSTAGGTAGTDKPVTLIGIRPGSGKFVRATGTLSRSKAISLSLVAEQDRVYA